MTCELGHDRHDATVVVDVRLEGKPFHDFASFPARVARSFALEVFDYDFYQDWGKPGFCPGRDGFSHGVITQGVWESWETRLACDILDLPKRGATTVLDFGAYVGWYTVLAAMAGHDVLAFEADRETEQLLIRNVKRNGLSGVFYGGRVDASSTRLYFDAVRLLKADVEGMEFEVLDACDRMIADRTIEYLLLEISPCFRPGYDDLLLSLVARGYDVFGIPDKTHPALDRFSERPLEVVKEMPIWDPRGYVASIRQSNVLAVRR